MSRYNPEWEVSEDMNKKIPITRKHGIRGEDGYRTFSVRVKDETVNKLEKIAKQSNRTRNELINILLEYDVNNYEIVE